MPNLVKISGIAGTLAAPAGDVNGDSLTLYDAAGSAYYSAPAAVIDALSAGPVAMASGKVRVTLAANIDLTRLQPTGEGAGLWSAKLAQGDFATRAPDLPAGWCRAIVAAA